jgi:hypothetical protein
MNSINRTSLLKFLPNGICAEIGVAKGKFSQSILKTLAPEKLFLIDSWENFDLGYVDYNMVDQTSHDDRYFSVVDKFKDFKNVEILRKRSIEGLNTFPDNFFDWVYIDADHSFDGCYNDLITAHPKIKQNGYICGHDYLADGKIQDGFGVNEAVHKFIKEFNYKLIFLTCEDDFKSYVLCQSQEAEEKFNNLLKI